MRHPTRLYYSRGNYGTSADWMLLSATVYRFFIKLERYIYKSLADLSIELPQLQAINAEFYIDFFMLSQCDVVGISNSIFSFAACLLNEQGQQFFRPSWDFSIKFIQFDPWNSLPLLYIGDGQPKILKRIDEVAAVALATQGRLGLLRCLCIQVPIAIARQWLVRAYLSYQGSGWRGLFRLISDRH